MKESEKQVSVSRVPLNAGLERQRVTDKNGTIGTVIEHSDLHNILVIYDNGGQGLYCLHADCPEYEPLFAL